MRNLDPGFNPDNQLVGVLDLGLQGYDETAGRQLRRSLRERVESLPGVIAVGFAEVLPLNLNSQQQGVMPEGYETPPGSNDPSIDYNRRARIDDQQHDRPIYRKPLQLSRCDRRDRRLPRRLSQRRRRRR